MTDRPTNPEARARSYAEEHLGIDVVHNQALEALDALEKSRGVALSASAERRKVDTAIADREMELISKERAANAEMSAAAFDRHIKVVFYRDAQLALLKDEREQHVAEHERAEADADTYRLRARVAAARLEELGGLLHFYAAVKQTAHRANDTDNTTRDEIK